MKHEDASKNLRVKLISGSQPTGKILSVDHFYGGEKGRPGPLVLVEWDAEPGQESLALLEELEALPIDGLQLALNLVRDDNSTTD